MGLLLRYEIDNPGRLRSHVHLVEAAGYFFFPGVRAAKGTQAALEVTFTAADQSALLRGEVWTKPAEGGAWLELKGARRCMDVLASAPQRAEMRIGSEQIVLVQGSGRPGLLCRLRDVSEGGARLGASAVEAGEPGQRVRVALPEAGPGGAQLEAFGRVVWAGEGEVGVLWNRGDLASRAAVRRMKELAEEEWEGARALAHPRSCRCVGRDVATPEVLLLG